MKHLTPLLAALALAAAAAPVANAWADPGDRGGRGGWRGDAGGQGWRGGGDRGSWRGGQSDGGRPSDGGRFQRDNGRYQQDGGRFEGDRGRFGVGPSDGARRIRDSDNAGGQQQGEGGRRGVLRGGSNEAVEGVRQGLRPMGQVLNDIQRRQPGRQLDAGMETWSDGRAAYRVRWAAENGRRIDYVVDARTGAILSVEGR